MLQTEHAGIAYTLLTPGEPDVDEVSEIGNNLERLLAKKTVDVPVKSVCVYELPDFWEGAFPHLFPYGTGSFKNPRPQKLKESDHDELLMCHSSGRFATSIPFIFARYMYRMSRQSASLAFIADKCKGPDQNNDADIQLNRELLQQVRNSCLKGGARQQFDSFMEKVIDRLQRFSSNMPSTNLAMKKERNKLFATLASVEMSMPTFFFTLSNQDTQWPELFDAVQESLQWQDGYDNTTTATLDNDAARRNLLLAQNPVLAARIYMARVESFLDKIIKGSDKPIGTIVDFWYRIEFQVMISSTRCRYLFLRFASSGFLSFVSCSQ
jgi:hypothetical protein